MVSMDEGLGALVMDQAFVAVGEDVADRCALHRGEQALETLSVAGPSRSDRGGISYPARTQRHYHTVMEKLVYLETTIFSYFAVRRSRDLIVAAHQEIT